MKANQFKYNRRIPICGGVHPKGGFVAWPDKKNAPDDKKLVDLMRRRRERRGFVAWPEKEKGVNW
jgi:hypothetical protein